MSKPKTPSRISKKSSGLKPKQSKPKKSKPKTSGAGPHAETARVKVTIDRALEKKWKELLSTLREAKRKGAGSFDVQWETVGAIIEHDPPLYLAGGHSTIRDFLEKHVGEDERTARRFLRVAKYASPNEEVKYGVSKLDRAIAYVEAKAGGPAKERLPIAFEKLKVPVERDGKTSLILLEQATVEEVEAATRKLTRASEKAPLVKASPLVRAVTAELKSKPLQGVTVRISGGKLFLGAIPPESLSELSKALGRVKPVPLV